MPSTWILTFPTIVDPEGDSVSVNVSLGSATFVSASQTALEISDVSLATVLVGQYSVQITLSDPYGSNVVAVVLNVDDPCLTNGISPLSVPGINSVVNGAPGSFIFSRTTNCGPASFALVQSFPWLTLSQGTQTATITVNSLDNKDAGSYQLALKTSLVNYPTVTVPNSPFTVVIAAN